MEITNWSKFAAGIGVTIMISGGTALGLHSVFNAAAEPTPLLILATLASIAALMWSGAHTLKNVDWTARSGATIPRTIGACLFHNDHCSF